MRPQKLQIVKLGTALIEKDEEMRSKIKITATTTMTASATEQRHETSAIKAQTQLQTLAHAHKQQPVGADKLITSAMLFTVGLVGAASELG